MEIEIFTNPYLMKDRDVLVIRCSIGNCYKFSSKMINNRSYCKECAEEIEKKEGEK